MKWRWVIFFTLLPIVGSPTPKPYICESAHKDGSKLDLVSLKNIIEAVDDMNSISKKHSYSLDLCNVDLSGVNLSGLNLNGANLIMANLNSANLNSVDLTNANLNRANLESANLSDAQLDNVNLSGNLVRIIFDFKSISTGANLSNANLKGASIVGSNLRNANLTDANLSGASLLLSNLMGANLMGANLRGADLRRVYLLGTEIDDKTRINKKWKKVWSIVNLKFPNY